jgi:hypothetical protein
MIKTTGDSGIAISKLAFLDEMLKFPSIPQFDVELEVPNSFVNLIKVLAAKTLTEEELLETLGDSQTIWPRGKKLIVKYSPSSK